MKTTLFATKKNNTPHSRCSSVISDFMLFDNLGGSESRGQTGNVVMLEIGDHYE